MAILSKKKSPPLHFVVDHSGETVCGKSVPHTRHAFTLYAWDKPGRRCETCRPAVEHLRAANHPEHATAAYKSAGEEGA